MGRRNKNRPLSDLMDIVAKLPWWVGVALAVVSFVVLHHVASRAVDPATAAAQRGGMYVQVLWQTGAGVGRFVLPVICLAGAAMSAWRRRQRKALLADVTQGEAADVLAGMTWQDFEMLVGEGFRQQGYEVAVVGGGGADGGVDLVLRRPGKNGSEKFLVQCKQWRAFKVGVDVVRELYGVMAAEGAAGGFVVTSGRFAQEATEFAKGRNVLLVDGPKLNALLRRGKAAKSGPGVTPESNPGPTGASGANPDVSCPLCSTAMLQRVAKRGANAGQAFWGCASYPACRGTRPMT